MLARRTILTAAIVAAGLFLTAGPAPAMSGGHGGGGGGQPAPSPAPIPAVSLCPEFAEGGSYQADGSLLFANDFPGQICMIVRYTPANVLSLDEIRLAPGWTSTTKSSGGGSSNRIDVEWSNPSTSERHEMIQQPGKTVIK